VTEASGSVTSREPGLDVFSRQPDGTWNIIRYLATTREIECIKDSQRRRCPEVPAIRQDFCASAAKTAA
jgi:hypothetical protein